MSAERYHTLFVTSKKGYTSNNGSMIQFNISPPLILDEKKIRELSIYDATVIYNFPNIGPEFGNNVFNWTDNNTTTTYNYVLESGLYGLKQIQETISEFLKNDGYAYNTFIFQGDLATGKLSTQANIANVTINWTVANSIGVPLGYTTDSIFASAGQFIESTNIVQLNNVNEILIRSNIVSGAVYNNDGASDVVASIQPNVEPQSQIEYHIPGQYLWTSLNSNHIDKVAIYLTDQDGNALNTRNEKWTATFVIRER